MRSLFWELWLFVTNQCPVLGCEYANQKRIQSDDVIGQNKGPFTLSLAIAISKSDSLVIAMLAKETGYPTHS